MAEACIVMQQVEQVYGKKQVLSDNNLTIEHGCIYGIVGPTGCGKTTLEKAMGGMKRRLSLAAAILHQPRILILDEPTVGIDPVLRRQIWQALYDMVAHGTTVIVTTHVMDEADRCFQLMMMRDGMVLETGSPETIKKKYGVGTIEEVFVMLGEAVQSP